MTTTPQIEDAPETDSNLWQLVCRGNTSAFEVLVRRYQSLICSVAYSACGNLALSEDVAQETFWMAWRQRTSLEQPDRLKAWLCGIARNLAKNARRKASRPVESAGTQDVLTELSTDEPGPADELVTREEESLVWQALKRIPAAYREPLILFYREDRSVAEVAGALFLSEDAVKQRLSRGRGMLRQQVAELVEARIAEQPAGKPFHRDCHGGPGRARGRRQDGPCRGQCGRRSVARGGWSRQCGWRARGFPRNTRRPVGRMARHLGPGSGRAHPPRARCDPQRRTSHAAGLRCLHVRLVLVDSRVRRKAQLLDRVGRLDGRVLGVHRCRMRPPGHEDQAHPREQDPDDVPNETALRAGWTAMATRFGDRVYRSEATFLGLPLVDINLGAPTPPEGGKLPGSSTPDGGRRVARGWIAIGDDARGILLAIGSTARGLVALGGRAFGAVSFGGMALGLVAFGGIGMGVLGIGGLGAGVYAFGGGAVGWRSAGGLAIGWDIACGGGAFAYRAAIGGAAVALDYAVGGEARARHANDEAARVVLLDHPFTRFAFGVMGQRQVLRQLADGACCSRPDTGAAEAVRPRQRPDSEDPSDRGSGQCGALGALQSRRRSRPQGPVWARPPGGASLRHCGGRR